VRQLVSPRITAATALRVLAQLRGDRRTMALLLIVPSVLMVLVNQMFEETSSVDRIALALLGIFPFTMMFLVTSVAMLRERTSGTLERLLTTPMSKLDLLLGYGIAFALVAAIQAAVTSATAYWLLGLATPGSPALVVGIAIASAVLGMALGLLCSAFATSEFQAVQFMPAVVMPQTLLGGLFVPREQMADWLQRISDVLPLTYAIEALGEVGRTTLLTGKLLRDTGIVIGATIIAVALAASTLRRRTGPLRRSTRRVLLVVPLVVVMTSAALTAGYVHQAHSYGNPRCLTPCWYVTGTWRVAPNPHVPHSVSDLEITLALAVFSPCWAPGRVVRPCLVSILPMAARMGQASSGQTVAACR
jgi:ABC-2 type transport system permease protein